MRIERAESSRLAWALAISVAFHLLLGGGYYFGKKIADQLPWLRELIKMVQAMTAPKVVVAQPPPQQQEPPLMFVEVSPAQETAEAPKNAKYYSDRNSLAANPNPTIDSNIPKITGKQTEVPKTEDVPKKVYTPLQPTPPPPITKAPTAKEAQEELKPKPAPPLGDLAMAKPQPVTPKPDADTGDAPRPRPKTIAEAKARPENRLAGEKMKQDGGVVRGQLVPSQDVIGSPFGAYDWELIAAVEQRWFDLLDHQHFSYDAHGYVVVKFTLHYDGSITEIDEQENTTGHTIWSVICEQAIKEPSPFRRFPDDMRASVGLNRHLTFKFIYY
ncbi:MAG: hypothetical protein C5B50_21175 [Verrucomicrobia bacterium]|nr:MAG: hypothetical protein C5B50_21175 [Verrucomicrobiota bacterium]